MPLMDSVKEFGREVDSYFWKCFGSRKQDEQTEQAKQNDLLPAKSSNIDVQKDVQARPQTDLERTLSQRSYEQPTQMSSNPTPSQHQQQQRPTNPPATFASVGSNPFPPQVQQGPVTTQIPALSHQGSAVTADAVKRALAVIQTQKNLGMGQQQQQQPAPAGSVSSSSTSKPAPVTTFAGRVRTFELWPHSSKEFPLATPELLAADGFQYSPNVLYNDQVTCVYCNLQLGNWAPSDHPHEIHLELAPQCPFATGKIKEGAPPTSVPTSQAFSVSSVRSQKITGPPSTRKEGNCWVVENYENDTKVAVPNKETGVEVWVRNCHGGAGAVLVIVEGPGIKCLTVENCDNAALVVTSVSGRSDVRNSTDVSVVIGGNPPPIYVVGCRGCTVSMNVDQMTQPLLSTESTRVSVVNRKAPEGQRLPVTLPEQCRFFRGNVEPSD